MKPVYTKALFKLGMILSMSGMIMLSTSCSQTNVRALGGNGVVAPKVAEAGATFEVKVTEPRARSFTLNVKDSGGNILPAMVEYTGIVAKVILPVGLGTADLEVVMLLDDNTTRTEHVSLAVTDPPAAAARANLKLAVSQNGVQKFTLGNDGTSSGSFHLAQNVSTLFDLSSSIFADVSRAKAAINFGDGSPIEQINMSTLKISHTYTQPGRRTATIVSGGDGTTGLLAVSFQVDCSAAMLAVSVNSISASKLSKNRYAFTANVTGGSGTFRTLWGFQNAPVYRNPSAQGLTQEHYEEYIGNQKVSVIVTDEICGTTQPAFSQNLNFDIPTSNGVFGQAQGSQVGGKPFIQGLLSDPTASSDTRLNGFMALHQDTGDALRVNIDQDTHADKSSSFNIEGKTLINDNQEGIRISGQADSNGVISGTATVTVWIAGNTDINSSLARTYTGTCSISGTREEILGPGCGEGPGGTSAVVGNLYDLAFAGTSSGCTLTDATGRTLTLRQGAANHAAALTVGNCGGGGGGGGSELEF